MSRSLKLTLKVHRNPWAVLEQGGTSETFVSERFLTFQHRECPLDRAANEFAGVMVWVRGDKA
jgi:hypothetical protein